MDLAAPCLCDTGLTYGQCCGQYHTGKIPAPNALALMRSRYTAVALGLADYMINTLHRSSTYYDANLKRHRQFWQQYCANTRCLGLVIVGHQLGDTSAWVHFEAQLQHKGQPQLLAERSRFVKLNQRWLYVDGEFLG
jgi:SEC-C motif domain protein